MQVTSANGCYQQLRHGLIANRGPQGLLCSSFNLIEHLFARGIDSRAAIEVPRFGSADVAFPSVGGQFPGPQYGITPVSAHTKNALCRWQCRWYLIEPLNKHLDTIFNHLSFTQAGQATPANDNHRCFLQYTCA